MSIETTNYSTLQQAVKAAIAELGDETLVGKFERLLQMAIECLTDLSIYHYATLKTVYLTMNDAMQVKLPSDYIGYNKIGYAHNGYVYTLSVNPKLQLSREYECGDEPNNIQYSTTGTLGFPSVYYADHIRNGVNIGGFYGASGGFTKVVWRIDEENNLIQFSGEVPPSNEIVLEYRSSGVSADGTTLISKPVRNVIRLYIIWKLGEYDKNISLGEKQRRQNFYEVEVQKLRYLKNHLTLDELCDLFLQSTQQTVKR